MSSVILHGRTVVPGIVEGEALVSHEPISGWGGMDPARGVITEPRHELHGMCFTGKILVFPSAKGSSGWSGFFQATRLNSTAPIGMVIGRISAKSALGAVVTRVPAVTDLDDDPCAVIATGDWVRIDNGRVEVHSNVGGTTTTPEKTQRELRGDHHPRKTRENSGGTTTPKDAGELRGTPPGPRKRQRELRGTPPGLGEGDTGK